MTTVKRRTRVADLLGVDLVDEPLPEGEPPLWPPRVSADYYTEIPPTVTLDASDYPGITRNNLATWRDGEGCSDPRAWRDLRIPKPPPLLLMTLAERDSRREERARLREAFRRAAREWGDAQRWARQRSVSVSSPDPDWE